MPEMHYSMKAAAAMTGLSPHVIRIWEKRYGAVNPERSETNRRRYSESELKRLQLLKAATTAGHNIGQIARLDHAQLERLGGETTNGFGSEATEPLAPKRFVRQALEAIDRLDAAALDDALSKAVVSLGTQGLLQKVVVPLVYRIGDLWHAGDFTAAQEHFATSVIRNFLGNHARPFISTEDSSGLVVATPLRQLHELGGVIVATAAANLGWRVVNLGASLPAAEIASAAHRARVRAVVLSIVYPEDDPLLADELRNLRRLLDPGQTILAGGRAVDAYAAPLTEVGATLCRSLEDFIEALGELRRP
jgi:DNA-binding transcriptional MerR regulator/methylmalonyl-CoA mutase cobalamin-binding subunit